MLSLLVVLYAILMVALVVVLAWQTVSIIRTLRRYFESAGATPRPWLRSPTDNAARSLLTSTGSMRSFYNNKCMRTSNKKDGVTILDSRRDDYGSEPAAARRGGDQSCPTPQST
jgi:hypothetical protein